MKNGITAPRTTLFYWFAGIEENRPGGPWWHRRFNTLDELAHHLTDMGPFLYAWATVTDHDECGKDCQHLFPPDDAEIIYAHGQ